MHAFRIGKPCFHASMQSDFSLFMQSKLSFGVTSWCFFFGFSRCMVTSLRNHLNFQNSFVSDKHQLDFCFCTKLWIPKNPYENMGFWREERKHQRISGFMSEGCAQYVICMNTKRHMILLTRKAHLTKKVLWHYKPNCQQD